MYIITLNKLLPDENDRRNSISRRRFSALRSLLEEFAGGLAGWDPRGREQRLRKGRERSSWDGRDLSRFRDGKGNHGIVVWKVAMRRTRV